GRSSAMIAIEECHAAAACSAPSPGRSAAAVLGSEPFPFAQRGRVVRGRRSWSSGGAGETCRCGPAPCFHEVSRQHLRRGRAPFLRFSTAPLQAPLGVFPLAISTLRFLRAVAECNRD